VAGAGPAGCAAAIAAARGGLDVLVIDKAACFPRDKACGDALTPRAVAALKALGVDLPGAHFVRGLIAYGLDNHCSRFEWPATSGLPAAGYTIRRAQLDDALLQAAITAGAHVELGQPVTGLLLEGGRTAGVTTQTGERRAPVVVDATGASSRLGEAIGLPRLPSRPFGVAVRGYMSGEGGDDQWLHSWLALEGADGTPLPGYGWVFPMGAGLFNVGVGQLSSSVSFRRTNYRQLLLDWVGHLGWRLTWTGKVAGAGLPMGIDRAALYRRGLLLAGDAAGLVNPFNGEGVSYGLQSGLAAGLAAVRAGVAGFGTPDAELALQRYHLDIKAAYSHYYAAGGLFADLMGHEVALTACLRYGLPHGRVMRPVNKLMANLIAPHGGPMDDRAARMAIGLAGWAGGVRNLVKTK